MVVFGAASAILLIKTHKRIKKMEKRLKNIEKLVKKIEQKTGGNEE